MDLYQRHVEKYEAEHLAYSKRLNRLSTLRLMAFIFSAILIVILANERLLALLLIVAPLCVLGFGALIKHYNQVAYLKQHAAFLKEINVHEIVKLQNKLSDFPTGQAFSDRNHPYVSDLDIFGAHSLFQLLNRTATESGQRVLADWLSAPATKEVILERQQAIRELTPKLDWRQHFQASGLHYENKKSDYRQLLAWIEKPVQLLPQQSKYLAACIVLSILSTSAAVYFAFHLLSADWFIRMVPLLIIAFVNARFLKRVRPITQEMVENTHNKEILGGYQSLILAIEAEHFQAATLQRLQSAFRHQHYSAAAEISKLKRILDIFQSTGNMLYPAFNTLWLLDIYWILMIEKWKVRNQSYLSVWAAAVSEFEVLSSVAGFAYANPSYIFPKLREESYHIHFERLGHPLISPEKRVCNDFHLDGRGKIALITGSNMAGKSTFLRTVGVNLVLAFMGAPCCAKSGQVSSLQLFTSMRTQDNLEEGTSSFYAELKRIAQLLHLIESGQAIFFLLDEMFKGTNSQDRHKGGASLIRQLSELNAFGMISTHDLELAKLAERHRMVDNYSFNSEIHQGEITFNYALTQGICRDFNASELMKKIGIKILPDFNAIG